MRLPRVRFSIKWMMFAVAVLALIMGAARMALLSVRYRMAANEYAVLEAFLRQVRGLEIDNDKKLDESARLSGGRPSVEVEEARAASARESERAINHFARLRRKYERAAWYPWLSVEPDRPWP